MTIQLTNHSDFGIKDSIVLVNTAFWRLERRGIKMHCIMHLNGLNSGETETATLDYKNYTGILKKNKKFYTSLYNTIFS